jgi:hypothetical protein
MARLYNPILARGLNPVKGLARTGRAENQSPLEAERTLMRCISAGLRGLGEQPPACRPGCFG